MDVLATTQQVHGLTTRFETRTEHRLFSTILKHFWHNLKGVGTLPNESYSIQVDL